MLSAELLSVHRPSSILFRPHHTLIALSVQRVRLVTSMDASFNITSTFRRNLVNVNDSKPLLPAQPTHGDRSFSVTWYTGPYFSSRAPLRLSSAVPHRHRLDSASTMHSGDNTTIWTALWSLDEELSSWTGKSARSSGGGEELVWAANMSIRRRSPQYFIDFHDLNSVARIVQCSYTLSMLSALTILKNDFAVITNANVRSSPRRRPCPTMPPQVDVGDLLLDNASFRGSVEFLCATNRALHALVNVTTLLAIDLILHTPSIMVFRTHHQRSRSYASPLVYFAVAVLPTAILTASDGAYGRGESRISGRWCLVR
ncbi:hypothetical protein Hypma_005608 [Hypsizygus marmoreus]|uniref:Uncharacterized protein n=1 Tax=Hypsizygus marmoreus TaxID=39966 RepID=A0A369K178_HYPMA|nr:hypothetical protein Hypma_005608 [Hypsizygus marmoreus]